MYRSGGMLPSQAAKEQERARALAEEIRGADPQSELVLSLTDDLDDVEEALQFALEYVESSGLRLINMQIPNLDDSLSRLNDDSTALSEALRAP